MKLRLGLILLLLLAGCSKNETPPLKSTQLPIAKIDPDIASTIFGIISFDGDAPTPEPIDMSQDAACVISKVPSNFGEAYAVNKKGHLQNVYVYIKDGLPQSGYATPPAAILDQKGCKYIPHVLGLMV